MPPTARLSLRVFGIALAGVLFGVPYEYCMDGYGYGFPFAWLHPYHDNDWGAYAIDPNEIAGTAIDYLNIALSLVLWAIAYFLAWRYFKRSSSNQAVSSGAKQ